VAVGIGPSTSPLDRPDPLEERFTHPLRFAFADADSRLVSECVSKEFSTSKT
jgi:hypothetical protein